VITIILKVVFAQPIYDHYKHDFQKLKDRLNKEKSASFASVLENVIEATSPKTHNLRKEWTSR